jgi:penicillin G amidase
VSGAKTATGSPLLAAEPHLQLPSPPGWHEIGLNSAGNRDEDALRGNERRHGAMNVYGTNFPGIPGIVHGFNDDLMWSSTTNGLDVSDLFAERVSSSDSSSRQERITRAAYAATLPAS